MLSSLATSSGTRMVGSCSTMRSRFLFDVRNEVDAVVASSSMPAGKPDPRAFQAALARLGTPADEAMMIGDSLQMDVRGALRAGLEAILLDRRSHHPSLEVRTVVSLDEVHFECPQPS